MPATLDQRGNSQRTMDRIAGLAEDAAFAVMIFSGVVLIATLILIAILV
jgi:hypothetical protein